jgi:DnaJ-class molecular chaperone
VKRLIRLAYKEALKGRHPSQKVGAVLYKGGCILLNIPAHSNSGSKLRIRGKGVPSNKGTRGDHIVKLKILLPDPPDPTLDSLIKSWHESRKSPTLDKNS